MFTHVPTNTNKRPNRNIVTHSHNRTYSAPDTDTHSHSRSHSDTGTDTHSFQYPYPDTDTNSHTLNYHLWNPRGPGSCNQRQDAHCQ